MSQLSWRVGAYPYRPKTRVRRKDVTGPRLDEARPAADQHVASERPPSDPTTENAIFSNQLVRSPPPVGNATEREVFARIRFVTISARSILDVWNIQQPLLGTFSSPSDDHFRYAAIDAVNGHLEDSALMKPIVEYLTKQRGPTIQRIREDLKRPNVLQNDELLTKILLVATIDRLQDINLANYHLKILSRLIQARGGIESISKGDVRNLMFRVAYLLSLNTGRSIAGPVKPPYLPTYPTKLPDVVLPSGFAALATDLRLSNDTIDLLRRATGIGLLRTSHAQRKAIQQLQDDPFRNCPILYAPDTPDLVLDKMICWSFFPCCYLERVALRTTLKLYVIARQYVVDRILMFQPKSQAEFECLIWLWFIMIDAYRTGDAGYQLLPAGFSLLQAFGKRFPVLAVRWDAIEDTVRCFVYSESLLSFWRTRWPVWLARALLDPAATIEPG